MDIQSVNSDESKEGLDDKGEEKSVDLNSEEDKERDTETQNVDQENEAQGNMAENSELENNLNNHEKVM